VERLRKEASEGKIRPETFEDASALLLSLAYIIGEKASPATGARIEIALANGTGSEAAPAKAMARRGAFVECKGGCGVSTQSPTGLCAVCTNDRNNLTPEAPDPEG
jgi:hypothetical protein